MSKSEEIILNNQEQKNQEESLESNEALKNEAIPEKLDEQESFIRSCELAYDERHLLRQYINDLKDLTSSFYHYGINNSDRMPPEVLKTDYIRELAKKKLYNEAGAGKNSFGSQKLAKAMNIFGIEEDFFKQEAFLKVKQNNWLERIGFGDKIIDPDRALKDVWGHTPDAEELPILKQDEELNFGELEETGLDLNSPEVKTAALRGMVYLSSSIYPNKASVEDYKDYFKISEQEFELALINRLKEKNLTDLKLNDKLRAKYVFIDDYLKSEEALTIAKQEVEQGLINSNGVEELKKYFSITDADINWPEVKSLQKQKAIESLTNGIKEDINSFIFYDMERASKFLSKEDWQNIFNRSEADNLTEAVACGFEYDFDLAKNMAFFKEIGLPDKLLHAGGVEIIASHADRHNNFDVNFVKKRQELIGLTEQEVAEGFSLGIIRALNSGLRAYDLESMKEKMEIANLFNSPKVQVELKKLYLKKIADADTSALNILDNNFDVKWQAEDRNERHQALKEALTDERNLASFSSRKNLNQFIEHNCARMYKIEFVTDPEIKLAVSKMLENLPFGDYQKNYETDIVTNLSSYFNISKEEVINQVKAKINNGSFTNDRWSEVHFKKYFPEIDLHQENEKCIQEHGAELIDKALENENWKTIKSIQGYNNPETGKMISTILAEQEANLVDKNKPATIRAYAIESLTNLAQGSEYLENNYFSELVEIYTITNPSKLLELFKKKTSLLSSLDDNTRIAMFEALINSSSISSDAKSEILNREVIIYLTPDQATEVFKGSYFLSSIHGLIKATATNQNIPPYLLDELYSRLASRKDDQSKRQAPDNFLKSLNELLQLGTTSTQIAGLLASKGLLSEIVEKPEAVVRIKQVLSVVPDQLLTNYWPFIYQQLKDSSPVDFERKQLLINKMSTFTTSWWINKISFPEAFTRLEASTPEQQEVFFESVNLHSLATTDFTEQNWVQNTIRYVSDAEEFYNLLRLKPQDKQAVTDAFAGPYRDLVLEKMEEKFLSFLQDEKSKFMPLELTMLGKIIDEAGGAGNLKYVESLGSMTPKIANTFENKKVAPRTKDETRSLLLKMEERMIKEKWLQDDKAEFRNLSSDIIEAAPSLYTSFLPLFEQFSPKEIKIFLHENLPLYQAKLVTIQEIKGNDGEATYASRDLVNIRNGIKKLANDVKGNKSKSELSLQQDKTRLLDEIKADFKSRFNIEKVPDQFNDANLRSIQNTIRYLGNISGRTMTHEAIISFYLGLKLNGDWNKFRQGQDIKIEEYLSGKQLETVRPIIEQKMRSYQKPLEVAGIAPEKASRFQELLQEESSSSMVGNISTVDIKLANLKQNLEKLADPDIYEKTTEKAVIKLLKTDGSTVNAALAKIFANVSGKTLELSDQENLMKTRLEIIYNIDNWNSSRVEFIQKEIQPLSLVTNVVNRMEEEKVEQNIAELQAMINPSDEIIEIFNSLGEEFKPESGALALSRDLSYLKSLMVKNDDKLSLEQKDIANKYLNSAEEKTIELEQTLDKVKDYFIKMKNSKHLANHILLKNRLEEIEKIINSDKDNSVIISHLTKDLDLVIENMRQCLGCLRKEANNDTNLAFGDYNKFFMFDQSSKDKGSVSDEIVFFLPVKNNSGRTEMSFVMDKLYGTQTPDILIANIVTLFKKYRSIKKEIPEAKISITVSNSAMSSASLNHDLLVKRLKEAIPDLQLAEQRLNLTANIAESALSDNYVEFGGSEARKFGDKPFSGTVLY